MPVTAVCGSGLASVPGPATAIPSSVHILVEAPIPVCEIVSLRGRKPHTPRNPSAEPAGGREALAQRNHDPLSAGVGVPGDGARGACHPARPADERKTPVAGAWLL